LPDGTFSYQKSPILGIFGRALKCKMLIFFKSIWNIFTAIWHMYFVVIWYIFPRFGTLYQEKSGNPACKGFDAFFWTKLSIVVLLGFVAFH
jgi:hypothetical protein